MIDTAVSSDNLLRFRKYLLERIWKLIMAIDNKIRDEKLQYDINRKTAKISPLSSSKTDEYKYLTGQQILPFDKSRIIEQSKFVYSPLGKVLKKKKEKSKLKL